MAQYNEVLLYARYSDRAQAEGMSLERQIGENTKWCLGRGLVPTGTILDEGKSGYHGAHRSDGALGAFEAEAQAGEHLKTLLVVERVDRLGREGHTAIMALINGLTANGVSVAIAKNNRLYNAGEEMSLVDAITTQVEADLAHKESVHKAERTASNWQLRREKSAATGKAMSATICPPWLRVNSAGEYEPHPEKVELLRSIFEMADGGMGTLTLTKHLNEKGKPVGWSNRKRKDISQRWQRSEIIGLLNNRAVIGEYQPKRRVGKVAVNSGAPIPAFYPAVIDPALFDRVAAAKQTRMKVGGGRKSARISNLVTGLVYCSACNGRVSYRSGYLYCDAGYEKQTSRCANRAGVPYVATGTKSFERALLDECLQIALDDQAFANTDEIAAVNRQIAEVKREHELAHADAKALWASAARTGSAMAEDMAREAEAKAKSLVVKLELLNLQRDKARGRADQAEHLRRVADIRANMDDPKTRLKVAHAFRAIIDCIWIHPDRSATVALNGGLAALEYRDGEIVAKAHALGAVIDGDLTPFADGKNVKPLRDSVGRMERALHDVGALGHAGRSTGRAGEYYVLKAKKTTEQLGDAEKGWG